MTRVYSTKDFNSWFHFILFYTKIVLIDWNRFLRVYVRVCVNKETKIITDFLSRHCQSRWYSFRFMPELNEISTGLALQVLCVFNFCTFFFAAAHALMTLLITWAKYINKRAGMVKVRVELVRFVLFVLLFVTCNCPVAVCSLMWPEAFLSWWNAKNKQRFN